MSTYALVHGGAHGSWCWELVAVELRRRGHQAIAMDLPCEDPAAGAREYARAVRGALAGAGDDVVLVAHDLGGLVTPVVAQSRPVRRLVFVSALLPEPGRSWREQEAREPAAMPGAAVGLATDPDGASRWPPGPAVALLYPDAPAQLANWAVAQLRRQFWRVATEPSPLSRWPSAEVRVIACTGDAVVNPDWVRRHSMLRFGVPATALAGDHSPFLARPGELVDALLA